MSERRQGIIRIPRSWFEDYHTETWRKVVESSAELATKLVVLPKWFEVISSVWDFDTGELKIKVESFYLPIVHDGELLPDLEIIYTDGLPTTVLVKKRVVIHTDTVEIPLNAP